MHLVPILLLVLAGAVPPQNPMPGTSLPGGGNPAPKATLDPKTPLTDPLPPAPRRLETTIDLFKENSPSVIGRAEQATEP